MLPGLSVMDRYLALELLMPFLFGVGAFSSLGVAIGSLFELVRQVAESGLLIGIAIKVLLLKMPEFIVYSFPMSTLLSALMTYSRFSSDSELIALRSCGISVYRLILPAVVLSFIITGFTFLFNELVVPAANYEASVTMQKALNSEKPLFQENNIIYPQYGEIEQPDGGKTQGLVRLFYAQKFDGQNMKGLTILDWSRQGLSQILTSESANWNPSQNTWDFFNGSIYVISPDASYRNILRFERQQLQIPRTPLDLASKERNFDEMNIAESLDYLQILRQSGDDKKVLKLKVRIQQKAALPFVCVVFGLVGAALGTRPQRTGRATSFGVSVIVIFSYYLLIFITGALGQVGIFTPFLAGWFPNMLGLTAGSVMLLRVAR